MSVKYKIYQKHSKNAATNGKWYARSVMTDEMNLKKISERIQRNCSMKASDVNAVLIELVEVMKDELQAGHRVKIDGFGSFRINIRTTGAESARKFSVRDNVKSAHVNFLPAREVNSVGQRVKTFLSGLVIREYDSYAVDKEESPNP